MLMFREKKEIRLREETVKTLEIPKLIAPLVKYWDSLPLGTKEQFFASYEKLEDMNEHDGCAYLTAKYAKNKNVTQMILHITAIHEIFGSMPYELDKLRYALTNPLYKKIAGQK